MNAYDHYDLDPVSISQRLDAFPEDTEGLSSELYELAEKHFSVYHEMYYEKNMIDTAMYELESVDDLLERAENDLQLRNQPGLEEVEDDE